MSRQFVSRHFPDLLGRALIHPDAFLKHSPIYLTTSSPLQEPPNDPPSLRTISLPLRLERNYYSPRTDSRIALLHRESSMAKMGDFIRSESKEIDLILHELSLMKQLIKERAHSLDLLRELISNACAKEVEATEVKVKYTMGDEGHIFDVDDNGSGMDFTGNKQLPGRLDRFLGLGLTSPVRIKPAP